MIALIQRVSEARVSIDGTVMGEIGHGILAFVGVQRGDDAACADRLLERVLGYRIFADTQGRMNLSVRETGGEVLLVPQFTLAADTHKGMRPGFSSAAAPAEGERLFDYFVTQARASGLRIATGRFGAYMQVGLVNDGPVTFWLHVDPNAAGG